MPVGMAAPRDGAMGLGAQALLFSASSLLSKAHVSVTGLGPHPPPLPAPQQGLEFTPCCLCSVLLPLYFSVIFPCRTSAKAGALL